MRIHAGSRVGSSMNFVISVKSFALIFALKLIFCKIHDERNSHELQFYARSVRSPEQNMLSFTRDLVAFSNPIVCIACVRRLHCGVARRKSIPDLMSCNTDAFTMTHPDLKRVPLRR